MATIRRKDTKNRVLKSGEYQKKNGLYEYKWRDKTGKRRSVYCKTLEGLREKEKEILKDVWDGLNARSTLTINDIYDRWVRVKRGLKETTFLNYKYMYEMFVRDDIGKVKLCDVKKSDIRAYYNRLIEERKLKFSTIDNIHTVLHQVLDMAVDDEYIRNNPSNKALTELKRVHERDTKHIRALTIQEQELLERFLEKDPRHMRWYPVFTVMMWTGMRVGELTALRWSNVDFERNVIHVDSTLSYCKRGKGGCGFLLTTPKTEAGYRFIPMTEKVKAALLKEKEYNQLNDEKCTVTLNGYDDFVFLNRFGTPHHQGSLNRALQRIIRDCNFEVLDKEDINTNPVILPNFSNHWLRHTFATRMCEAGVHLKAIQAILGHSDVETTLNIYTDATTDFTAKQMEILTDFYDKFKDANSGEPEHPRHVGVVRPLYDNSVVSANNI